MRFPASATLLLLAAACSDGATNNAAAYDVDAAALRAQDDIANYAAERRAGLRPVTPTPTPTVTPTRAVSAPPSDDDQVAAASALAKRYVGAIAAGRYADAYRMWRGDGEATGTSLAGFAGSFARYATYDAIVGAPFDADAGAGQRYITIPVTVTGTLATGGAYKLVGTLVLHRTGEGIESDDPHAHEWRIDSAKFTPET